MIVLVTGSRDWDDADTIESAILSFTYKYGRANTIIHGGASGADKISGSIALALGYGERVYRADWNKYGKRAGYIRNKQMVDLRPDICLAFIRNNSRGATMCARLAEDAGIPTVYYRRN